MIFLNEEEVKHHESLVLHSDESLRLLIDNYKYLYLHIAKKYKAIGDDIMDIYQAGIEKVLETIHKYDFRRGGFYQFSSYRLMNGCASYVRNGRNVVKPIGNVAISTSPLDIGYEGSYDFECNHDKNVKAQMIRELLSNLTEEEVFIVSLRERGLSLINISLAMNKKYSKEKIRQIIFSIREKLKSLASEDVATVLGL